MAPLLNTTSRPDTHIHTHTHTHTHKFTQLSDSDSFYYTTLQLKQYLIVHLTVIIVCTHKVVLMKSRYVSTHAHTHVRTDYKDSANHKLLKLSNKQPTSGHMHTRPAEESNDSLMRTHTRTHTHQPSPRPLAYSWFSSVFISSKPRVCLCLCVCAYELSGGRRAGGCQTRD